MIEITQILALGFTLDREYPHDQFHTKCFKNGLLEVDLTYLGEKQVSQDLTIGEENFIPIEFPQLEALAPILGKRTKVTTKQKIYIAGKVTGEDRLECAAKFAKAKQEIEADGFIAVNPLEVVGSFEVPWEIAMRKCIKALMDCDKVFMLPCCAESKGARLETRLARQFRFPIANRIEEL